MIAYKRLHADDATEARRLITQDIVAIMNDPKFLGLVVERKKINELLERADTVAMNDGFDTDDDLYVRRAFVVAAAFMALRLLDR